MEAKTFLQAQWSKLVMANYAIDAALLAPYLPYKTEIDLFNGACYVSLVGFMFLNTKIKGWSIPFHANFEEVNLRFYVRYNDNGEWKRGVVFIKEFVPKPALTFVANTIYKENYETLPMRNSLERTADAYRVQYQWKKDKWHSISITTNTQPAAIMPGSEAEFITEHYWGYTRLAATKTSEYGVEHPRWDVYETKAYTIDVNFSLLYGNDFAVLQDLKPVSVFLAEGSDIKVMDGRII